MNEELNSCSDCSLDDTGLSLEENTNYYSSQERSWSAKCYTSNFWTDGSFNQLVEKKSDS